MALYPIRSSHARNSARYRSVPMKPGDHHHGGSVARRYAKAPEHGRHLQANHLDADQEFLPDRQCDSDVLPSNAVDGGLHSLLVYRGTLDFAPFCAFIVVVRKYRRFLDLRACRLSEARLAN